LKPRFLDFFAGSGLVTQGLKRHFAPVWANDICERKRAIYVANHGEGHFSLGSIAGVRGVDLPTADLAWASFPCQDLSLAGKMGGLDAARSGLVWEWLRVLDEMHERPSVLAVENVAGLVSGRGGQDYRLIHQALVDRGYIVGPMLLDAVDWLPQSRPRVFIIAVNAGVNVDDITDWSPNWSHPTSVRNAAKGLDHLVWWRVPKPPTRTSKLSDVVDFRANRDAAAVSAHNVRLIPEHHWNALERLACSGSVVVPGYRRTRNGRQCLELRFDGVAGCLRTPEGGSSKQILVFADPHSVETRFLTTREAAALMGAPKRYKLPGSSNDGYKAMGDGVAVPVVAHLAKHLLKPLALRTMTALQA